MQAIGYIVLVKNGVRIVYSHAHGRWQHATQSLIINVNTGDQIWVIILAKFVGDQEWPFITSNIAACSTDESTFTGKSLN